MRQYIHRRIQVVSRGDDASYFWIRIELSTDTWAYLAICYFSPRGSRYATQSEKQQPRGDSPYTRLSEDIIQYSSLGEVFLMGDFNGRTQSRQCDTYDMEQPDIMRVLDPMEIQTYRQSADDGPDSTGYGAHLLELGSRHHLVIYNGMRQWPRSGGLTCFPHGGGESTVDYLMGSLSGMQMIDSFDLGQRPIGADHTFLTFSLHTTLHRTPPTTPHSHTVIAFTHELSHIYAQHLHERLLLLDPHEPLDSLTAQLTSILHESATLSFPHHTHTYPPRTGTMPQNGWYDEECREGRRQIRALEAHGEITHRQSQRRMQSLTRRKKREWEETQYWEIYHLLMSRDSKEAWRRIRERRQSTPIHDPVIWRDYAESLYHVPHQPVIPTPQSPRPTDPVFFTTSMVKGAISRLQHGRVHDQFDLQAEHTIYGRDTLASLLAHLFNRATAEGFSDSWIENTIIPIHKSRDASVS
eukprot:c22069_g1_i1 orf=27-1430(-)